MKRLSLFWVTALGLGWLWDFLFWKHTPGINFALYVAVCLIVTLIVLGQNGYWPSRKSIPWFLLTLLFASVTFLRAEPLTVFLVILMTFLAGSIWTITYRGGRWIEYTLRDYLYNGLVLISSLVAGPVILAVRQPQEGQSPKIEEDSRALAKARRRAILRGVLLALPILAIFTCLLASADLIFAERLSHIAELLFDWERLARLMVILIIAYLLMGMFLHAAQKSTEEQVSENGRIFPPFLGFTEASIVLGSIIILFALFTVVQIKYLFGGETNIGIEGYTYAEYARRGFGELLAVAFLSLFLFLSLSSATRRQNRQQRAWFSGLGVVLVALLGVILASAFQRLSLYEAAYGFSRLRLYPHVFMVWLGILLLAVAILEIVGKERFMILAFLGAMLGFSLSLPALNVDGRIVRQNVARALRGEELDVSYLASLSADAVPALVEAYHRSAHTPSVQQAIGAALTCLRADISYRESTSNWRSFTLPRYQRDQALDSMNKVLEKYTLIEDTYPPAVITPDGFRYSCP